MRKYIIAVIFLFLASSISFAQYVDRYYLEGVWEKTCDFKIDGVISGKILSNKVNFTRQGDKFFGKYIGDTEGNPSIFEGQGFSKQKNLIYVVQKHPLGSGFKYYSIISAVMVNPNKFTGTWCDSRGNMGDLIWTRSGYAQEKPSSFMTPPGISGSKVGQSGCRTLSQVYTDGSGDRRTKKLGGNYAAIRLDSLRDDDILRVEAVSGRLTYVTLHARYQGGYWRTIYKGPKTEFPVGQYIAPCRKDKNCTHINVSINGAHEKYDPVACRANLVVCGAPDKPGTVLTPSEPLTIKGNNIGLVAYYPFDGDFQDHSGNGNNGTPRGVARFVNGVINSAVELDGKTVITAPQPAGGFNFSNTNAFTMSAWIYISSGYNGYNGVMSVGNFCDYRMMVDPGLIPFWDMGRHLDRAYGEFKFKTDRWYHYAIVGKKEGSRLKTSVYVNGNLLTTLNENMAEQLPNGKITYIGSGESGNTHHFKGKLDDVRIYNRAISHNEVRALYNKESGRNTRASPGGTVATFELSNAQKKMLVLKQLYAETYHNYQNLYKQYGGSQSGGFGNDHPVGQAFERYLLLSEMYNQIKQEYVQSGGSLPPDGEVITGKMKKDVLSELISEVYQRYQDSMRRNGIDHVATQRAFDLYQWLIDVNRRVN